MATGYVKKSCIVNGVSHPYQEFYPANYDSSAPATFGMILSLCGSGERGNDGDLQITVGLGPRVTADISTYPLPVCFAQMSNVKDSPATTPTRIDDYGVVMAQFMSMVQSMGSRLDPTKIYINGNSDGGRTAWDVMYANADMFAAAMIVAANIVDSGMTAYSNHLQNTGAGTPITTASLNKLPTKPIHTFHGSADSIVPVQLDRDIAAIYAADPNFLYTEYAGLDHGQSWDTAYADYSLTTDWLMTKSSQFKFGQVAQLPSHTWR